MTKYTIYLTPCRNCSHSQALLFVTSSGKLSVKCCGCKKAIHIELDKGKS